MKLYMHPVSMTSRPVLLYVTEYDLPVETEVVDLFTGEHMQPPYSDKNPNKLVPMIEDGDFRLTESSAILKFLAERFEQPHYPKELRKRAKVNEMMDWFNTQFYRDYGYGLVYPQIFPHHQRPSDELQQGTLDWHKDKAHGWFQVLDQHWLGDGRTYLCGDQITVADFLAAGLLTVGEVIRCNFEQYPNVHRWLGTVKQLNSWPRVNETFYGFASSVADKSFQAL
jgi:glutathione S-transferase